MKIGFIGFGNMGSAIALGISNSIVEPSDIVIYDKDSYKTSNQKSFNVALSSSEVVEKSDVIFLCVKPKDLSDALAPIKNIFDQSKILISILAGVRVEKISKIFEHGSKPKIVRVMPNTPALVGEGAIGIFFDTSLTTDEKETVNKLLSSVGKCVVVEDEDLMDAITGLSGSGPAYVFLVIQALADGGVKMGLSRETSLLLAAQTVFGSAKMLLENINKFHPEQLKDMVMSPKGTTVEGITVLEENRVRFAFIKAVEEATKKSKELSK